MRFWLPVFALVVLLPIISVLTWRVSCQPYEGSSQNHTSASDSVPPAIANEQRDPSTDHQSGPIKDSPGWCAAIERPEWWTLLAVALTGIAIAYQAREMAKTTELVQDQAVWMKRQAELMNRQSVLMLGQLKEMRASGKQMETMLEHAGNQASHAAKQTAAMIDTAERQLRAYVCVTTLMLKFIGTGDSESFEVQVEIKNTGQTPAYDVKQWARVFVDKYPLSAGLPEPPDDFEMSSSILATGGTAMMVRPAGQYFPAPTVTLGTPNRTVWVYGKIAYRDAFSRNRTTKYRFYYGGEDGMRTKLHAEGYIVGIMRAHKEGNEAD